MFALIGEGLERVDGRLKVRGEARYVGDLEIGERLVHAALVTSDVAAGRVVGVNAAEVRGMAGVAAVFTHQGFPKLHAAPVALEMSSGRQRMKGSAGEKLLPLQSDEIVYGGQIVAAVVADSWVHARAGAMALRVEVQEKEHVTRLEEIGAKRSTPPNMWGERTNTEEGHVDAALALAHARVEETYVTPMMHHVTMEMHGTVAAWRDGKLTVWEPTTWVAGAQKTIAAWFGIAESDVRVVNHYVGGSFGSKGPVWPHVAVTAAIARELGRPVRMHLTRAQTFTCCGYRPRIKHAVKLGADHSGKLVAIVHEAVQTTSMFDTRIVAPVTSATRMLYACENIRTRMELAHVNLPGPFTMRAPGEAPGMFALESAMDELAWKLGMDPVELRIRNDAAVDPESGKPWSSKHLTACYRRGAETFGWQRRVGRMGGNNRAGMLVGMGMATMTYEAKSAPAKARAAIEGGRLKVTSSTCEQGTGSRTIMRQIAAEATGVEVGRIDFDLGDTEMPAAPISAGSMTTASVGSAVQDACAKLAAAGGARGAELLEREGLAADGQYQPGEEAKNFSRYSFGAHFAEVRIDPLTHEVRVAKLVGAYAAGRIINERTARSQYVGGMVWGLGMALMEHGELCPERGRVITDSLADYLVPTCPDMPTFEVVMVEEEDETVNPIGVKGIGELGTIGTAAAITNAVFHATGMRVRELPVIFERL